MGGGVGSAPVFSWRASRRKPDVEALPRRGKRFHVGGSTSTSGLRPDARQEALPRRAYAPRLAKRNKISPFAPARKKMLGSQKDYSREGTHHVGRVVAKDLRQGPACAGA